MNLRRAPIFAGDQTIADIFAVIEAERAAEQAEHVVESFMTCTTRRSMREPEPMLRVGDTVVYRGGWGTDEPRETVVMLIEINCNAAAENGEVVQECPWSVARRGTTLVDINPGGWAYGSQLYPDLASAELRAKPTRAGRLVNCSPAQPSELVRDWAVDADEAADDQLHEEAFGQ